MKWYAGATLLLVLGLIFGLGALAYAMYVLLAVLVVSRWLSREWIEGLAVHRRCNLSEANVGDRLAMTIEVSNRGRWPVPWVLLEDVLPTDALRQRPPRIRVSGSTLRLATLRPGASAWLNYQVCFQARGYYQFGPLVLETGDLFGLHRRYRVADRPHFVLVFPQVVPIFQYDIASRRPIGEIRMMHRLFEDPTRISGVRDYQPGEPLSRVHWRATARTRTLQSKTFDPSSIAGATILLDFHRRSYPTRHEPNGSELAITCAASLAHAVSLTGQQIGLITNAQDAALRVQRRGWTGRFRSRRAAVQASQMPRQNGPVQPLMVPTRRGPEQMTRILETLARAELSEQLDLSQLLHQCAPRLPRNATVIAVVARIDERGAASLAELKRRGYALMVLYIEFERHEALDTAGRLAAAGIEARQITDEESLAEMGSQPVLW